MRTIADKLTYLSDTKAAIKSAIIAKGVTVSDSDTFRSYADKISSISGGGGSSLQERVFNIEDRITAKDVFIPAENVTKVSSVNCVQETNDNAKTKSTLTISVRGDVTLLACIMYRGDSITISDDYGLAWEQIVVSKANSSDAQKIIVYKAHANLSEQADIIVTATQNTSVRMSMKIFALEGQRNVSVIENVLCASMPYSPSNQKTSQQIHLISSVYASTDGITMAISQAYTGALFTYNEQRFYAAFDPNWSVGNPTVNYYDASNYTSNTINALVLGIE